jgi:hypothetical protein
MTEGGAILLREGGVITVRQLGVKHSSTLQQSQKPHPLQRHHFNSAKPDIPGSTSRTSTAPNQRQLTNRSGDHASAKRTHTANPKSSEVLEKQPYQPRYLHVIFLVFDETPYR